MKKITSLILALVMMFSLCISANAEEVTKDSKNYGAPNGTGDWIAANPVGVKVTTGEQGGTRYYVTVKWDSMNFTYKRAAEGTWNVENHMYDNSNVAGWKVNDVLQNNATATFTVENHSNADVDVFAAMNSTYAKTSANRGVEMALSNDDKTLTRADVDPYLNNKDKCDSTTYTLTVRGEPDNDDWGSEFVTVDGIAVVISVPTP